MKNQLVSHATDTRPPTLMFARCPGTKSGFLAIPTDHEAHPARYDYVDEASAEAYRRELVAEPPRPRVLVVTAGDRFAGVRMVRGLLRIQHAVYTPAMVICGTEEQLDGSLRRHRERGEPALWLVRDDVVSEVLDAHVATGDGPRLVVHAPRGAAVSPAVARVARRIRLR